MAKATSLPVQVFRDKFAENLERVTFGGERLVVTKNGKPRAAMVSLEDLARLEQLDSATRKRPARRRP
ncbi:MAG: type II toxin-antitoxin system Phd/YefM family antitoxin [Planctomycetes bacterium]|nr:type II toxin-antitoxin system Phd/YefM family antitoxin [Planctomycetota bacterium]